MSKPFVLDSQCVGRIPPNVVEQLRNYPQTFQLEMDNAGCITNVSLNEKLITFEDRTKAVDAVMKDLRDKNVFPCLNGWRDEVMLSEVKSIIYRLVLHLYLLSIYEMKHEHCAKIHMLHII